METGGNCNARGKSGEGGCYQFMPSTWAHWSKQVFGYVEKQTPINEEYVALHKIQHHLNQGYDEGEIALIWNQGHAGQCKAGTNSKGVDFNSCDYQKKVLVAMR